MTVATVILKPEEIEKMSPVFRAELLRVLQNGLEVWRQWLEVSTTNLANIDTTRTSEGEPYRRKDVVFQTVHLCKPWGSVILVEAVRVVDDPAPFVRRFEPGHPDAQEDGYVNYPNMDLKRELANITAAARGYEASIAAIKIIFKTTVIPRP
jgi:flagellar basal-body rod protein FlgC